MLTDNRLRPAYLLLFGAFLLAVTSVAGLMGREWLSLAALATAAFCAALVLIAFGMRAARGRSAVVAIGMIGAVTGVAAAGYDLIGGTTGPFLRISTACAGLAVAAYALSHARPRPALPKAGLIAFASGVLFVLTRGPVEDFMGSLASIVWLLPAAGWGWFGAQTLSSARRPRTS